MEIHSHCSVLQFKKDFGKTIDRCQTPDILKIFPNSILIADIPDIFQNQ